MKATEEITGTVNKIIFTKELEYIPEGRFYIVSLDTGKTAKGNALIPLSKGEPYRFYGRWVDDSRYGEQFQFSFVIRDLPLTEDATIAVLTKECKNVGSARACALWDHFGSKCIDTILDSPADLVASGILNETQAKEASESLQRIRHNIRITAELMAVLSGKGFPQQAINEIMHEFGPRAPRMVLTDPFAMTERRIYGCGFKRVDQVYLDAGLPPSAPKRQAMCIYHSIAHSMDGSVWYPHTIIHESLTKNLASAKINIPKAVAFGIRKNIIRAVRFEGKLFVAESGAASSEANVALFADRLLSAPSPFTVDFSKIERITPHQRERIALSFEKNLGILEGTPGTGKTFTVAALVDYLTQSQLGHSSIALMAPTGKAAFRLTAALREFNCSLIASTIHSALGYSGRLGRMDTKDFDVDTEAGWVYSEKNTIPASIVIIDEASMVPNSLMARVLRAVRPSARVLLVGDSCQLPPIDSGAPLRDFISSGRVPVGSLTEIHRNAGAIAYACRDIKQGKSFRASPKISLPLDNYIHVEASSAANATKAIFTRIFPEVVRLGFDPIRDVQFIVAVNDKSDLSRKKLNLSLQAHLNPDGATAPNARYRVGDKVICLTNGQYIAYHQENGQWAPDGIENEDTGKIVARSDRAMNGEIGIIVAVLSDTISVAQFPYPDRYLRVLTPRFLSNKEVKAERVDQQRNTEANENEEVSGNFDLGYAVTCHKMQGSDSPVVILIVDDYRGASYITSREWVYTGLSRAKRLLFTVGKRETIDRWCRVVSIRRRKTLLAERLAGKEIITLKPEDIK